MRSVVVIRLKSRYSSTYCAPREVLADQPPPDGTKLWMAFRFQFQTRLEAFPSTAAPGCAWFASKNSSLGVHRLLFCWKASTPAAPTNFSELRPVLSAS